jgi:prepilin signal peptidase PulO-like enzyme (type II secretory pathway)
MFGVSPGGMLRNMLGLLYQLWLDLLGIGAIGAAVGLPDLAAKRQGFAGFLVVSMAGTIVFLGAYDVVDRRTMLLPALIALMPLVAVGLSRIGEALEAADWLPLSAGQRAAGAIVALGLVIGFDVYLNWESVDRSADYSAYVFADAVMEQVADDAFIVAQWTSATPLEYMQIVEGRRPDVEVFDRGLFILGIRDQLVRGGQQDQLAVEDAIEDALIERIRGQLQQRPVYLIEDDPFLRAHFCLVRQQNDIYRLVEECESSSTRG